MTLPIPVPMLPVCPAPRPCLSLHDVLCGHNLAPDHDACRRRAWAFVRGRRGVLVLEKKRNKTGSCEKSGGAADGGWNSADAVGHSERDETRSWALD